MFQSESRIRMRIKRVWIRNTASYYQFDNIIVFKKRKDPNYCGPSGPDPEY
jgi:hypothetical protein